MDCCLIGSTAASPSSNVRAISGGTLERFGIHSDSLGGSYLESLEAPSLPDALGMGTKYVVVPYSSLMVRDKKMMLPGATKDSLKALPEFKYAD